MMTMLGRGTHEEILGPLSKWPHLPSTLALSALCQSGHTCLRPEQSLRRRQARLRLCRTPLLSLSIISSSPPHLFCFRCALFCSCWESPPEGFLCLRSAICAGAPYSRIDNNWLQAVACLLLPASCLFGSWLVLVACLCALLTIMAWSRGGSGKGERP